jgi:hypothetical protein
MGVGMVDLDPEIWNNKTLGEAATNGFADEEELQAIEDAAAKRENREPWIARRLHRYPGSAGDISIENSYDNGMRLVDPAELTPEEVVEFIETEEQHGNPDSEVIAELDPDDPEVTTDEN